MVAVLLFVSIVWLIGFIGVCIINRIQPNNRWYPVWAAGVCILFTVIAVAYVV